MKRYFYKSGLLAFAAVALLTSCDPEIDAPASSRGDLDFTKYIAVGNSLTAGYQDGGLYREGQIKSYPNILAEQFRQVGGGEFVQPLFSENQKNGSGYLNLAGFTDKGAPILAPVTTDLALRGTTLPGGPALTKDPNPAVLQNLGVPGISVLAASTPLYGGINPYFERLLDQSEVGQKSYIQFIANRNHTFFSCWLGNNDVLTYATNGGELQQGNPFSGMTDEPTFRAIYTTTINTLTANGSKGIVATIPDVAALPFFTTVTVDAVRAAGKAINSQADVFIKFGPAANNVRLATSEDLILLTTQSKIGIPESNGFPHGFTPLSPLLDTEVLDKDEVIEIRSRTQQLNSAIKDVANSKGLAIADMFDFFNKIQPTIQNGTLTPALNINGVAYSPAFISGNLFSLDGVHPTPRGYAIIANEMIKAINAKYNAAIPTTDVAKFRAVLFPWLKTVGFYNKKAATKIAAF